MELEFYQGQCLFCDPKYETEDRIVYQMALLQYIYQPPNYSNNYKDLYFHN
uniref:Uncharacterized protein n=1 Tax=virus sp. ctx9V1 TaxID=2828001 RepID=A0A8S5RDW0_9VIRU|nr:MAG TPA: protein of unknown function DUF393 [virus sp. ctx9V1]